MALDLDALSRPLSRERLLATGELIDTTQAAAWRGFKLPAAVTAAVWSEVVGIPGACATLEETASYVRQLELLWSTACAKVIQYRKSGAVLNSVRFTVPNSKGRPVPLRLVCSVHLGVTVVTICLDGEA